MASNSYNVSNYIIGLAGIFDEMSSLWLSASGVSTVWSFVNWLKSCSTLHCVMSTSEVTHNMLANSTKPQEMVKTVQSNKFQFWIFFQWHQFFHVRLIRHPVKHPNPFLFLHLYKTFNCYSSAQMNILDKWSPQLRSNVRLHSLQSFATLIFWNKICNRKKQELFHPRLWFKFQKCFVEMHSFLVFP